MCHIPRASNILQSFVLQKTVQNSPKMVWTKAKTWQSQKMISIQKVCVNCWLIKSDMNLPPYGPRWGIWKGAHTPRTLKNE